MARHYSTRDFFRQMPNALLKRYFEAKDVFGDIDFSALSETKPDVLFAAWLGFTECQRNTMDAEFRDVFEMSCDKGFRAIVDEARWHLRADADACTALVKGLAALGDHFERAMVTFLDHPQFWKGATRFYHADSLPYWRKRKHLSHQAAAVDPASIQALANLIRSYFHQNEGRGNNCVVEPFRRGELDYFFAYPEDYSQQSIEWVNVIFVYSQAEGSLDLNFRGSYKAIEPLQGMFATTILKLGELPPDPKDARVYDLAPLLQKSFDFTFAVGSGIEKVTVKKLRLSSRSKKGERIALEADTSENPDAVYALLEKINVALPLHLYSITQVELAVTVTVDPDKPAKVVTVRITHPNSSSLKYDELDLKLRNMLSASGIEPRELVDAIETPEAAPAP